MSATMKHPDITKNFVMPLWHEKSTEVIDNYFSPSADVHTTFIHGVGPDVLKKSVNDTFFAFPQLQFKIDEVLEQSDKLIYRWQASGNHEGHILDIAPTGRIIRFAGLVYGEIKDGLITRYHSFSNIPQVLKGLSGIADPIFQIKKATDYLLTGREIECLRLWLQGFSLKESGRILGGISHRTVQSFREKIKWKLNLTTANEIINYLTNRGVISLLLCQTQAL